MRIGALGLWFGVASTSERAEEGGYYHVVSRGVEQRAVYLDDADRRCFLELLGGVVERREWSCLAFCLMGDSAPPAGRDAGARPPRRDAAVERALRRALDQRYGRVGHLFRRLLYAARIKREAHLFATVRYVVLNPVAAGICADAVDWPWSSHREVVSIAEPAGCAVQELLELFAASFGGDPRSSRRYARFVDGMSTTRPRDMDAPKCVRSAVSHGRSPRRTGNSRSRHIGWWTNPLRDASTDLDECPTMDFRQRPVPFRSSSPNEMLCPWCCSTAGGGKGHRTWASPSRTQEALRLTTGAIGRPLSIPKSLDASTRDVVL